MAKAGICSECPKRLERPNQKTCSQACRSKRARRLKRVKVQAGKRMSDTNLLPPHQKAMSVAVNKEAKDIAHELLREELQPVVRESLTQEVLEGIGKLVALTPQMVDCIAEDLESEDKYLRQKAYTLLARYTLGNQSVAPAPTTPAQNGVNVTFLMPRPGDPETQALPVGDVVEVKTCAECNADKPETEFVGTSLRCQTCHDALLGEVNERFGDDL